MPPGTSPGGAVGSWASRSSIDGPEQPGPHGSTAGGRRGAPAAIPDVRRGHTRTRHTRSADTASATSTGTATRPTNRGHTHHPGTRNPIAGQALSATDTDASPGPTKHHPPAPPRYNRRRFTRCNNNAKGGTRITRAQATFRRSTAERYSRRRAAAANAPPGQPTTSSTPPRPHKQDALPPAEQAPQPKPRRTGPPAQPPAPDPPPARHARPRRALARHARAPEEEENPEAPGQPSRRLPIAGQARTSIRAQQIQTGKAETARAPAPPAGTPLSPVEAGQMRAPAVHAPTCFGRSP